MPLVTQSYWTRRAENGLCIACGDRLPRRARHRTCAPCRRIRSIKYQHHKRAIAQAAGRLSVSNPNNQ